MKGILEKKHEALDKNSYLAGKLLVSMPYFSDPEFSQMVVYLCGHDELGAIGLVINKNHDDLKFDDLLSQLKIKSTNLDGDPEMHYGGPVDESRGFVLHSTDYLSEATIEVSDSISVTGTMDVLRNMAVGKGPKNHLVALGYSGWDAGQLEQEIQNNAWLVIDANEEILFTSPVDKRWHMSFSSIGVNNPSLMSLESGRA